MTETIDQKEVDVSEHLQASNINSDNNDKLSNENRSPPLETVEEDASKSRTPVSSRKKALTDGDREASPGQPMIGGSIVGDVLYSIATGEEEGKSRQRILTFAAKRYQTAVERNEDDYDALYNWALVLQESADNCPPQTGVQAKDNLLDDACRKYAAATALCPTLHEAFYNWAIAISDRAKIRGRTRQAEELWNQACDKYSMAVQLNWDSPQALNNWGLALQELGGIVPKKDKRRVVRKAISKFRAAIRLRFDFHRAVYNLGTVLYGLAEDTMKSEAGGGGRQAAAAAGRGEHSPAHALYAQSAVYITAAHALKADYPVYLNALRLVRTMLPLPYLKSGFLRVPPHGNPLAPHKDWMPVWAVLDHEAFYQIEKPEVRSGGHGGMLRKGSKKDGISEERRSAVESRVGSTLSVDSQASNAGNSESTFWFDINQILSVQPCSDLSLPEGGGIVLESSKGTFYMVADLWEVSNGWLDAIRLVYTINVRGKSEDLAGVLAA